MILQYRAVVIIIIPRIKTLFINKTDLTNQLYLDKFFLNR